MKKNTIVKYVLLLPVSFILFGLLWSGLVAGRLYKCTDPIPVIEMLPPYVHGGGDYYIASETTVYIVWLLFMMGVVLLPAVLISLLNKISKTKFRERNN